MKAKKKPIEKFQPSDLGVDVTPILEVVKITEPPKRVGGTKVHLFPSPKPILGLLVLHRFNLSMNWSPS